MGYVAMGDVSSDNFNSTKYPGIVKPSNTSTLATFKRCQTQMNRVAAAKGFKTIAADGDIGPGTVSLFELVKAHIGQYALANNDVAAAVKINSASGAVGIASVADVIANEADSYADSLGAAANPPAPQPTKPPTLVDAKGFEKPAPAGANLLSAFESMPTTYKVVAVAILGGIGFFVYKDMSKMGKRRRSRR